jgi:excisionase family DNA binding protein
VTDVTVPEAARRVGKNPETIRRWIREGRLPARKVGTQHVSDERDLQVIGEDGVLPAPDAWNTTPTGEPMPDWVAILRRQRAEH